MMSTELKCQTCFAPLKLQEQRALLVTCPFCGADNVLPRQLKTVTQVNSRRFASILYRFIAEEFNLTDIQDLIMRLNGRLTRTSINFEDLRGQSRKDKARELVQWSQRYDELETLISVVQSVRPSATEKLPQTQS